jgi:hypothetical protein
MNSLHFRALHSAHFAQQHLLQCAALKLVLYLSVLVLTPVFASAQTQVFPRWTATLNNFTTSDVVFDEVGNQYPVKPMVSDFLGNTYITGFANITSGSSSHQEMLTIKFDADGHLLWKAWLGNATHPAQGVAIAVDATGNVYALGSMATQNGGLEFATAKYNTNGVRQWVDYFFRPDDGQNIPAKIAVSAAGDAYVAGTSSFESATSAASAVAIKYETNGKQAWSQSVENCCNTIASVGVGLDAQENVYWAVLQILITGTDVGTNIYKYDAQGNLLKTVLAGGFINSFQVDSQGNYYVAGTTNFQDGEGDEQPIVAEFKAAGSGWTDVLGPLTSGFPQPASIAPNSDGSVFVSPVPGGAGLTKFSPTGAQLWTVQNSGLLAVNSFGDVYVAGQMVSKYDPNGLFLWQQPFEGPSHQPATPTAINTAGGGLIVTGMTSINGAPASVMIDYVQDAAKLTPESLMFPSQAVGTQSPAQIITIKNTAEQSLAILNIISASLDFPQTNNCPASLAPGASCTISVTFAPASSGTITGQLEVKDPWAGSPQFIPLTGAATQ